MAEQTPIVKALYEAMGGLYKARYIATGPVGKQGNYPEMDHDAFDSIVHLQTDLQRLITELSQKE